MIISTNQFLTSDIQATTKWAIIVSDNGLSSFSTKPFAELMKDHSYLEPEKQTLSQNTLKKMFWKCRPQNVGEFVSVSIWSDMDGGVCNTHRLSDIWTNHSAAGS